MRVFVVENYPEFDFDGPRGEQEILGIFHLEERARTCAERLYLSVKWNEKWVEAVGHHMGEQLQEQGFVRCLPGTLKNVADFQSVYITEYEVQ